MTAEPNAAPTVPPGIDRRNLWTFGVGTIGRDMVYTLVSLYLVFFLSDVLRPAGGGVLRAGAPLPPARRCLHH